MNALSVPTLDVRTADLRDVRACTEIDAFVRGRPDATPFHLPAWSRAVEQGCGQRAHYLVARGAGDRILGVLPLTEVRSLLFGRALVSAGFAVGGGILADGRAAPARLTEAALALARQRGCGSIELRGGELPDGWTREEGTYAGFARALAIDEPAILAAIPRKQRAEVRRALPLEWRVGRGDADLADHYRAYSESVRNLGTPVFPRALFRAMRDAFGDGCDILTITDHGQVLASVFSLYLNDAVYPYWGGGVFAARAARANEALYFRLMCHAAGRGCTRFDFGRSKLGTGAFAYKKNWGFAPEPLVYSSIRLDGAPARSVNPLDPRYRRKVEAWKRLPLWLANRVGPPLARGLG